MVNITEISGVVCTGSVDVRRDAVKLRLHDVATVEAAIEERLGTGTGVSLVGGRLDLGEFSSEEERSAAFSIVFELGW